MDSESYDYQDKYKKFLAIVVDSVNTPPSKFGDVYESVTFNVNYISEQKYIFIFYGTNSN